MVYKCGARTGVWCVRGFEMTLRTFSCRRLTAEEAAHLAKVTHPGVEPGGSQLLAETWTPVRGEYECPDGSGQQAMASAYAPSIGNEDSTQHA